MVDEPSVEDTIAILRGLKERYEVHHGVRIQDAALVAAAVLSHRYISDRFLPDKAVDLVDEAASRLKIELDSMPTEIDVIEREIMQHEMERQALKKEKDPASKERLKKIEKELAELKEKSTALKAEWQKEKAAIDEQREAERRARTVADGTGARATARRIGESERDSIRPDSRAGKKARARATAKSAEGQEAALLREEVTEEDIARGCLKLDGHSGLAFAGRRTRETGEDGRALASARGRSGGSDQGGRERGPPRPRRFAGPESADRLIYFSRADRRR